MPVRIDVELARILVAAQFPRWADLAIRPVAASGWDNRTFHLGEEMLIRMPRHAHYAPQVEKEQRWLPWLASRLPTPIPEPLGLGRATEEYPLPWSIYRWIAGETAAGASIPDMHTFARDLAGFLEALHAVDAETGPVAGEHSFFRGGSLATYDAETRSAIAALAEEIDALRVTDLWESALSSAWDAEPVWVHGDYAPGNLLVRGGRLAAVIDFGCSAVGDPACDLAIAWSFLDRDARAVFREHLPLDPATWARGRGWALWKALILAAKPAQGHPDEAAARGVIAEVLSD